MTRKKIGQIERETIKRKSRGGVVKRNKEIEKKAKALAKLLFQEKEISQVLITVTHSKKRKTNVKGSFRVTGLCFKKSDFKLKTDKKNEKERI